MNLSPRQKRYYNYCVANVQENDGDKKTRLSISGENGGKFDMIDFLYTEDNGRKKVSMVIRGQPVAWRRPISRKTKLGRIYHFNPNQSAQEALKKVFKEYLGKENNGDGFQSPLFGAGVSIKASFKFLLARPDGHFNGNLRIAGAVKNQFVSKKHVVTPDADNLVKFMMDKPMKGVFFVDDSQFTSLKVMKEYDVLEHCRGHIEIVLEQDD